MKVEVELSEIEKLKNEILFLKEQAEIARKHKAEAEEKLMQLLKQNIYKKAVDFSFKLFNDYLECAFKNLGFNGIGQKYKNESVIIGRYYELFEKDFNFNWHDEDRAIFELGANVEGEFRKAFLKIGIIPKKEDEHFGI